VVTVIGVIVTDAVLLLPLSEAVIVTVWLLATVEAVALTLAVLEPAAMLIDGAIARAGLPEPRVTITPPEEAAWERVTVQVVVSPETSEFGEHCTDVTVVGTIV
jgi:hypothetical protein